ncbi:hypothetical protein [Hyalangium versicolor]|uniref:hypothetical protein n=1 Tax=Hyalangium versicolor TaxID=2861190 RepID=UPI001CCE81CC|nr:hypothetical protein [Hyalangium versicolor]
MRLIIPTLQRLCMGLALIGTAGTASARTAPPNLHFIVDTSGSMRELPQVVNSGHAEFFNITTNGCENPRLDAYLVSHGWDPSTVYPVPDEGTGLGSDTGHPNLFRDNKFYGYMYWADSSDPSYQWNSKEEACQSQVPLWDTSRSADYNRCLSCLNTKGYYKLPEAVGRDTAPLTSLDFIFWGRHLNFNPPKYVTVKAELKKAFKDLQGKRVGFSVFAPNIAPFSTMVQRQQPNCDQTADASAFDTYRASYISSVDGLTFTTGTPLAKALLNAGYYFTSGDDVYQTTFGFGSNYSYPFSFKNDPLTSQSRSVCWTCQTSAIILISDGEPSSDSVSSSFAAALRTRNQGPVYCPDSQPCASGTTAATRDMGANATNVLDDNPNYYLDDVAKLLNNQDLQLATPSLVGDFDTSGQQSLKVYTVGFGINSNLFKNTAAVGGGLSFSADGGASLQQAIQSIVSDVEEHSASCVIP